MAKRILEAPLSLKADVWAHFGFKASEKGQGLDKTNAICRHHNGTVRYSGNTTNLRAHLHRHHADKLAAAPKSQQKPVELKQTTLDNTTYKFPSTSPRAIKITDSVVHFICLDLRPYCVVENRGFRYMVNTLEPRYVIPTRRYIIEIAVPRKYEEVKEHVKTSLTSAARVALTCDGWTSRATQLYVTITCHFITDDWELMAFVLQTRAMHESHTGTDIAELLKTALDEWSIASKIPAIVTDNAANMTVAAELTSMLHFKCFAHTLNLASQRALKLPNVARLLGRVRRITSFFRRSVTASHVLQQKQKLLQLPEHKLLTDVVTRWNSAHDMLQRFLEQQPAISAALLSGEIRKTEKEVCTLSESDITSAEEIVDAMKPMKVATLVMSQENIPTLSVVAPLHAQLLHDLQENPSDSALVKEIKSAICEDLSKRYKDKQKDTLYVCAAMDPRFKALPFLSDDERQDIYEGHCRGRRDPEQAETETADPDEVLVQDDNKQDISTGPPTKRARSSCSLADLLGQTYSTGGNPLSWWKEHQTEYPLLSRLAKTYLCIPGTSVSSEIFTFTYAMALSGSVNTKSSYPCVTLLFSPTEASSRL
ncbi:zinc finger BED domain-containing protein 1-like [Thalassophryne amazonica]|uniref:zinc finger BED domain-containing protein 1-like n=1 Tax=Thalassophryne amazonica TaxID=390379 RepID=UPI001470A7CA|nr:zinc finger BED domain-containing protein 1-like [Thalassophryne amazonica]